MRRLRLRRWLTVAGLAAMGSVALAAGLFQLSKLPCLQLIGEMHCRVDTRQKLVALTFDDGPTQKGVDAVFSVLERSGSKATFFLIGQRIAEDPKLARRLAEAGHELGNHTYTHTRRLLHWPGIYRNEIARTDALLREAGQSKPSLLRPPYGKRLVGMPLAAQKLGYRTIMWDVPDTPEMEDEQVYANAIVAGVRPGSIVLMHPMHGQSEVVGKALPIIVRELQERGFRLVTVSELLKAGAAD